MCGSILLWEPSGGSCRISMRTTRYLIHLILDEMYSVDLIGTKIKKSFGTALKIVSTNMKATSLLLLATVLVFYMTPSTERFVKTVLSFDTYKSVKVKLLPKARWF